MILRWEAPEYEYVHKTTDWYWAVWIIAISVAVAAVIYNNFFLSIFALIAAATLTMLSTKKPEIIDHEINTHGVRIGSKLFPHNTLESYWIEEYEDRPPKLLIKSKKKFMTLIVIPLGSVEPGYVMQALDPHIPEVEIHESIYQRFMEYVGF